MPKDLLRLSAPLLAIVVATLLIGALPALKSTLLYQRELALDGQLWRLLSAHGTHFDWRHLAMNTAGYLGLWLYCRSLLNDRTWFGILLCSSIFVSGGIVLFNPEIVIYGGLSGTLHGALMAICLSQAMQRDPIAALVLALLIGKIAWEQNYGALHQTLTGVQVAVDAHMYGGIGGCFAFAAQTALSFRLRKRSP